MQVRSGTFTPRKEAPEGSVGPSVGLEAMKRSKIFSAAGIELRFLGRLVRILVITLSTGESTILKRI